MNEYNNGCGDTMRLYNKQKMLQDHPELAQEVVDVFSLKIFVFLDLFIFSIILGVLLYPLVDSVRLSYIVPITFFLSFTALYFYFCKQLPDDKKS